MAKFKKRPVCVEAYQLTPELLKPILFDDASYPYGLRLSSASTHPPTREIRLFNGTVTTIHGQDTRVTVGDWIIDEGDGEHFYPCKPDIFEATYEAVN
jgi:hypothetical protein